jgi:hypothetical protein
MTTTTNWGEDEMIEVIRPCWLIATGDDERLEVLRSPAVRTTDDWYRPVRRYIEDHGLVLAAQESFDDDDWMMGEIEMSVYVPPASRNESYAEVSAGLA